MTHIRGASWGSKTLLGQNDEVALVQRAQNGELQARNELIIQFTPLIHGQVGKFIRKKGLDWGNASLFDELVNVAIAGMPCKVDRIKGVRARGFIRAIETFDPAMGFRLATHARESIRAALKEWHRGHCDSGVRGRGRGAPILGHSSLDAPLGEGANFNRYDFLPDEEEDDSGTLTALREELKTLTEIEQRILDARHFPESAQPSFAELGKQFNHSCEWARLKYKTAINKLRLAWWAEQALPSDRTAREFLLEYLEYRKRGIGVLRRKPSNHHIVDLQLGLGMVGTRRSRLWNLKKYKGRTYSREEREAFVRSRPDLATQRIPPSKSAEIIPFPKKASRPLVGSLTEGRAA